MKTRALLERMLAARLGAPAADWLAEARAEVAGCDPSRFCALLSQASRHARGPLAPTAEERALAGRALADWDPERWTLLEAVRALLVLSRPDLDRPSGAAAVEEAFRYADVGELCALYKVLAHLPDPARFAWRAGEGARSNMKSVFEAATCDTPYPVRWFDDVAWRQAVIKCLFVESPLWRLRGLDRRLDAELARMALDLADERHAAGRLVWPQLFLCLGREAGQRGRRWIERLLSEGLPDQRRAAALALARSGQTAELTERAAAEPEGEVRRAMERALAGHTAAAEWPDLEPAAG